MNYEQKWKILDELVMELQKRGERIPTEITNDLRSAKTIIQVLKADPTITENISRIEAFMISVETYIVLTAEKLEKENIEKWLRKLQAPKNTETKKPEAHSRFIPGFPRSKNLVRIQISKETPLEYIKKLAKENKIYCKKQENKHVIVYGRQENIKSFVKAIAKELQSSRISKKSV